MYNLIFILGAQGSGKTTVGRLLKEKLHTTYLELDWIRGFHLDKEWKNTSDAEEAMSFENLSFLLKNYVKHAYTNVIVSGFEEKDIAKILAQFNQNSYIVITLYLTEDEILKQRVLTESRDSGFRNFKESIRLNKRLREALTFSNEHKIDNTNQTPEETASQIVNIVTE